MKTTQEMGPSYQSKCMHATNPQKKHAFAIKDALVITSLQVKFGNKAIEESKDEKEKKKRRRTHG